MRKPGWYWVKCGRANDWECKRLLRDGRWARHDGVRTFEPDIVGPRIPTPDEPWQCVPVEPTREMLEATGDKSADAYSGMLGAWTLMLKAAPKPESQP